MPLGRLVFLGFALAWTIGAFRMSAFDAANRTPFFIALWFCLVLIVVSCFFAGAVVGEMASFFAEEASGSDCVCIFAIIIVGFSLFGAGGSEVSLLSTYETREFSSLYFLWLVSFFAFIGAVVGGVARLFAAEAEQRWLLALVSLSDIIVVVLETSRRL